MTPLDFFLREHASVHTHAAAGSAFNVDWLLGGLNEAQWRAQPHGLNSVAWLVWHIARVEDSCVAQIVAAQPQLLNDAWVERLGVDHRDRDGEGMTKEQVSALTETVDITALRAYRDAVCEQTQEIAQSLWPDLWSAPFTAEHLQFAAETGAMSSDESTRLIGMPREALLNWWAVHHSHYHIGQASMVCAAIDK